MSGTNRGRRPAAPPDRRRLDLAVAGTGLLFLLCGCLLLTLGDAIPLVLSCCVIGRGIGALRCGIIQILDSGRAS